MELIKQVTLILFLVSVGIFLRKKKIVTPDAARMFANFVLTLVSPTLLVEIFQRDFTPGLLRSMGLSILLVIGYHVTAIGVTWLIYRKRADENSRIERMMTISSNCGYMGIPLMSAIMGQEMGTLFAGIYMAVFMIYIWTHGVMGLTNTRKISMKAIFTAPGTIGAVLGIVLFLLQIRLPVLVLEGMSYLTCMNTPLPTILMGIFIADVPFRKALANRRIYIACGLRLLVLPLLFLGIIWISGAAHWFPGAEIAVLAVMISCSCPGAVTTILMPARFGLSTQHGAMLVAMSTLFSIATIPMVASLAQLLLTR